MAKDITVYTVVSSVTLALIGMVIVSTFATCCMILGTKFSNMAKPVTIVALNDSPSDYQHRM